MSSQRRKLFMTCWACGLVLGFLGVLIASLTIGASAASVLIGLVVVVVVSILTAYLVSRSVETDLEDGDDDVDIEV